jgi:ring-1,2-phenylacetyl-CoA epoxidase subunit PaaA
MDNQEILLQSFQAYVDAENKIEAKDWMPDALSAKTLIRQIAHSMHIRGCRNVAGRKLDHTRSVS